MAVFSAATLFVFFSTIHYTSGKEKVRLADIQALTLYAQQRTTGRRSNPVPQIKCIGGSAGCEAVRLSTVQCYNRGTDGFDVQWECKADLPAQFKFGTIQVSCEGYDYADDPYVLKGSCGFEYTLDRVDMGTNDFGYKTTKKTSFLADVIFWIIIALFLFVIYRICIDSSRQPPGSSSGNGGRWNGGGGGGGGGGAPPPYHHRPDDYYGTDDSCHRPTQSSSFGSSGFWTGLGAGGLLGYLWNRDRSSYNDYWRTSPSYRSSPGPSTSFGTGFGGMSTSSGFGGTRRR